MDPLVYDFIINQGREKRRKKKSFRQRLQTCDWQVENLMGFFVEPEIGFCPH